VAGDTPDDAIAVGKALFARGIFSTFDLLGEDVRDRDAARRSAEANKELLRRIPEPVERNISIKLSMLGLEIADDFCLELVSGVLDAARQAGGFVRIDMEGSKHTQRTIDLFRQLRRSYENVGIVFQAMLRRTEQDVREAIRRHDRVRLCKGAYREPADIAFPRMDEIRASYRRCAELLLEQGNYPAIATHDESLVGHAIAHAQAKGVTKERFEFQMLYGLRPRRWDQLVADGHNVRIYVPYGTHWFPYFYRRLRERKENVFFVLKNLVSG
jgi:proline dehydrogenase